MSTYGRKLDDPSRDSCFGIADKNDSAYPNCRATVFGAMPSDGHAYAMGILAGYFTSGDPAHMRIGAWSLSSGGNPSSRKGQTAELDADVRMTSADGHYYEADLTASFLVEDGKRYALGFVGNDGKVAHGQTCDGTLMYFVVVSSGTVLPNPMAYDHATNEGKLAVCLLYEPNVAPKVPTNLSPSDGSSGTDTTPTYAGDFRDDNEVLPNGLTSDYLLQYQVQVRSVAAANATTGSSVWDSGIVPASGTERTNRRFSIDHPAGAPLTPGQRYQMRARVWDRHEKESDFSNWTDCDFLVSSAGIVTLDQAPSGRTTDTTPDFSGRWFHGGGLQMDKVQILLYLAGATGPIQTGAVYNITNVNSSALPGTSFTVTWANTGFSELAPGVQFEYAMLGQDTNGVWSEISARRSFFTNSKPGTPIPQFPLTTSPPSTSRPQIVFYAKDPEGDALTGSIRIKNSGGSLITTVSPSALGSDLYGFQTTGTQLASVGTYKWDSKVNDGDLDSDYSPEQTFQYLNGPSVTITSPTEAQVITTGAPTITWTTLDQTKKRIQIYRVDTGALVHDSGWIVSTFSNYAMPNGILDQDIGAYQLYVSVEDLTTLQGTSSVRNFSLVYTPPDPIGGFIASPEYAKFDIVPSVIRLRWIPSALDGAKFLGYYIYRGLAGGTFQDAEQRAYIPGQSTDTWVDYEPASGQPYTYYIIVISLESVVDIISSVPVSSSTSIVVNGSVISDVDDGGGLRAVLNSITGREESAELDQIELDTWAGGAGYMYEGLLDKTTIKLKGNVYRTDAAEVGETLAALRALARYKTIGVGADAVRVPVYSVYRDERGRVIYGRQLVPKITDQRILRADVDVTFRQLDRAAAVG